MLIIGGYVVDSCGLDIVDPKGYMLASSVMDYHGGLTLDAGLAILINSQLCSDHLSYATYAHLLVVTCYMLVGC